MIGWSLLTCAALAVIPTTNRNRDLAARPVRGDGASVRDVTVDPAAVAAAARSLEGRARVAVLPFTAPAGDAALAAVALGCAAAAAADLHYVPGVLALDPSEVRAAPAAGDLPALAEAGRALGARYLLTGSVARKGERAVLTARLVAVGPSGSEVVAEAEGSGAVGDVDAIAATALAGVLPAALAPGPDARREMARAATADAQARASCDEAADLLERSTGLNSGDGAAAAARALALTEKALKADRSYLRASLVQAGCLARRGETGPLKKCLNRAHNVRVPAERIDALTRLEVDGDYYLFVTGELPKAADRYDKMLAIDPGHLHALWALTALYAGEFGTSEGSAADLKKANEYAARLVAAHPGSAAARYLTGPRP
jgi:TolB-like protein